MVYGLWVECGVFDTTKFSEEYLTLRNEIKSNGEVVLRIVGKSFKKHCDKKIKMNLIYLREFCMLMILNYEQEQFKNT